MIVELRVYHCVPGKVPVLMERFKETSLPLWDKLGIRQAGFFTTLIGPSNQTLTYLLAWDSLAERERLWKIFISHPEFVAQRAKYAEEPEIVERVDTSLMLPTAFSALR